MVKTLMIPLYVLLVGCGSDIALRSIDDGPGGEARTFAAFGPIHSPMGWQSTVNLYIADDAPEIIVEATMAAIKSWNSAAGMELMTYEGRRYPGMTNSLFSVLDDDISMIYYESDWSKTTGKADYVLGTTVWENGGDNNAEIKRGDIILNGEHFYFQDAELEPDDDDRLFDIADAESVILHELGHLLGLDHVDASSDPFSVMHATTPVGFGFVKRSLSAGDADLISQIYKSGN